MLFDHVLAIYCWTCTIFGHAVLDVYVSVRGHSCAVNKQLVFRAPLTPKRMATTVQFRANYSILSCNYSHRCVDFG